MTDAHENSDPPPFDEKLAASYVGKYILVGLTYEDYEGNLLRRIEIHGVITSADRKGVRIALRGAREGQIRTIPYEPRGIFPADPGSYRLHSTDETVEDPDLVSTWTITEPPPREAFKQ